MRKRKGAICVPVHASDVPGSAALRSTVYRSSIDIENCKSMANNPEAPVLGIHGISNFRYVHAHGGNSRLLLEDMPIID